MSVGSIQSSIQFWGKGSRWTAIQLNRDNSCLKKKLLFMLSGNPDCHTRNNLLTTPSPSPMHVFALLLQPMIWLVCKEAFIPLTVRIKLFNWFLYILRNMTFYIHFACTLFWGSKVVIFALHSHEIYFISLPFAASLIWEIEIGSNKSVVLLVLCNLCLQKNSVSLPFLLQGTL